MKKLIYSLVAIVAVCSMTSCEKDWPNNKVSLSLEIECMTEEPFSSMVTGGNYIRHTYICNGYLHHYTGECSIEIWNEYDELLSNDCKIKAAGGNTSFAFSFIEDFPVYRENPSWNYVVKVIDNNGNCLCQTMVVGKHTI